jgi:hypothetical protein
VSADRGVSEHERSAAFVCGFTNVTIQEKIRSIQEVASEYWFGLHNLTNNAPLQCRNQRTLYCG